MSKGFNAFDEMIWKYHAGRVVELWQGKVLAYGKYVAYILFATCSKFDHP